MRSLHMVLLDDEPVGKRLLQYCAGSRLTAESFKFVRSQGRGRKRIEEMDQSKTSLGKGVPSLRCPSIPLHSVRKILYDAFGAFKHLSKPILRRHIVVLGKLLQLVKCCKRPAPGQFGLDRSHLILLRVLRQARQDIFDLCKQELLLWARSIANPRAENPFR